MSNMINFGNTLGKKYKTELKSDIQSDAEKSQAQKDQEALRKHASARRAQREARMAYRDEHRKSVAEDAKEQIVLAEKDKEDRIKRLEENKERNIESQIEDAKERTNHLARKHGLEEPNNPEALTHDRLHCYKCDMKLHIPNAYKNLPKEVQQLFDNDSDIRHLCCFCFGKMEHEEIMELQDNESDKKIRMAVYNPEQYVRENADERHKTEIKKVEDLTKERIAYYNAKIKKYEHVISLIGKVKYNIQDVDDLIETVRNHAPTRYNYSNN